MVIIRQPCAGDCDSLVYTTLKLGPRTCPECRHRMLCSESAPSLDELFVANPGHSARSRVFVGDIDERDAGGGVDQLIGGSR